MPKLYAAGGGISLVAVDQEPLTLVSAARVAPVLVVVVDAEVGAGHW